MIQLPRFRAWRLKLCCIHINPTDSRLKQSFGRLNRPLVRNRKRLHDRVFTLKFFQIPKCLLWNSAPWRSQEDVKNTTYTTLSSLSFWPGSYFQPKGVFNFDCEQHLKCNMITCGQSVRCGFRRTDETEHFACYWCKSASVLDCLVTVWLFLNQPLISG